MKIEDDEGEETSGNKCLIELFMERNTTAVQENPAVADTPKLFAKILMIILLHIMSVHLQGVLGVWGNFV